MRALIAIFLSISVMTGPLAKAEVSPARLLSAGEFERVARDYGNYRNRQRSARIEESLRRAKPTEAVTESLGHQAQALVVMMMVAGADIVRQEIALAKLKGESVNTEEIADLSGQAAEKILLGGATWAGFAGAAVAGGVTYKPMKVIRALIDNSASRPIFKNLLKSGIGSIIAFTGWEFGGELWDEARDLIEDDADYERVANLGSNFISGIFLRSNGAAISPDDVRVAKLMVTNMFRILILDNEMRNLWAYNAWRFRIATGGFATVVTSMVGAGVIGTALFPGAGTVGGLAFGVAGGTIAAFTPDAIQDPITDAIVDARLKYHVNRAHELRAELAAFNVKPNTRLVMAFTSRTEELLNQIEQTRNDLYSVKFEAIHRAHLRMRSFVGNRKVAAEHNNLAAVDDLNIKIAQQTKSINDHFRWLMLYTAKEKIRMQNLKRTEFSVAPFYERQITELNLVTSVLVSLSLGLVPDADAGSPSELLLTKLKMFGFNTLYFDPVTISRFAGSDI